MRTEKRYANVGERILITNGEPLVGQDYENGDILTVREAGVFGMGDVKVEESSIFVDYFEYEVIIEEPAQASTHNESLVLTRLFNAEAEVGRMSRSIDELKAKVEALEKANEPKYVLDELIGRNTDDNRHVPKFTYKTPSQRRADVIKRAEAFVEDLLAEVDGQYGWKRTDIPTYADCGRLRIEFVVNNDKRTVVALARLGNILSDSKVYAKGIARCAPDDVFNDKIGKAISLGRALGVSIPQEFLDAPQPTEVVVGMRVKMKGWGMDYENIVTERYGFHHSIDDLRKTTARLIAILDDSEAVYE